MNKIKTNIQKSPIKFVIQLLALLLGIGTFVLYIVSGKIREFTPDYSIWLIVFFCISIIANLIFLFVDFDTLEVLPFVGYVVCLILFIAVNANYLVAVIRAIDVTSVSITFVLTIVLLALSFICYGVSFLFRKRVSK